MTNNTSPRGREPTTSAGESRPLNALASTGAAGQAGRRVKPIHFGVIDYIYGVFAQIYIAWARAVCEMRRDASLVWAVTHNRICILFDVWYMFMAAGRLLQYRRRPQISSADADLLEGQDGALLAAWSDLNVIK